MIEAKDLRIGNWVIGNNSKHYKVIAFDIVVASKQSWFTPIPLTPEVLEKCGFENGLYMHEDRCIGIFLNTENGLEITDVFGDHIIWNKSINYLHELQNLFYSLTGEELQIKL